MKPGHLGMMVYSALGLNGLAFVLILLSMWLGWFGLRIALYITLGYGVIWMIAGPFLMDSEDPEVAEMTARIDAIDVEGVLASMGTTADEPTADET